METASVVNVRFVEILQYRRRFGLKFGQMIYRGEVGVLEHIWHSLRRTRIACLSF